MPNKSEFENIAVLAHSLVKPFIISIHHRNWHWHNAYEMMLLMEGGVEVSLAAKSLSLREGDIFLLRPRQAHALTCGKRRENLIAILQFPADFCSIYCREAAQIQFEDSLLSHSLDSPEVHELRSTFLKLLNQQGPTETKPNSRGQNPGEDSFQILMTAALLNQLFYIFTRLAPYQLIREQPRILRDDEDRTREIIDFMAEHYRESVILNNLAARLNLDSAYLSRYFKRQFSCTLTDYVTRLRLSDAIVQLESPKRSLGDIARSAGFTDLRAMNRAFQKNFDCDAKDFHQHVEQGHTPTALRAVGNREFYYPSIQFQDLTKAFLSQNPDFCPSPFTHSELSRFLD